MERGIEIDRYIVKRSSQMATVEGDGDREREDRERKIDGKMS